MVRPAAFFFGSAEYTSESMNETGSNRNALVLFSGGQDSTVCMAWALKNFDHVETIGFDYGQRHRVELEARARVLETIRHDFPAWAAKLGEDQVLDLNVLKS